MAVALRQLKPFVRDGQAIETGPPLPLFHGARPREILGNWLICAAINHEYGSEALTFVSDPEGGDGIIVDRKSGAVATTEHIIVPRARTLEGSDSTALILAAIKQKRAKGGNAYASGKTLVVMLHRDAGRWFPTRLTQELPAPLYFDDVWVVGLVLACAGEYTYSVTKLDLSEGNAPAWLVWVSRTFRNWRVHAYQRGRWSDPRPLEEIIKAKLKPARSRAPKQRKRSSL